MEAVKKNHTGRAFIGDSPELMNNSMYQNQRIDLGEQP